MHAGVREKMTTIADRLPDRNRSNRVLRLHRARACEANESGREADPGCYPASGRS